MKLGTLPIPRSATRAVHVEAADVVGFEEIESSGEGQPLAKVWLRNGGHIDSVRPAADLAAHYNLLVEARYGAR